MDEKEYMQLLDKAYEELPDVLYKKGRFEVPQVKGKLIKTRTQITNFKNIAETLIRPEEHLLKYFLKEAGVRGEINERGILVLHSRYQPSALNKIIEKYYNLYVECPHCRSPDTELKDDGFTCKACGHHQKTGKI